MAKLITKEQMQRLEKNSRLDGKLENMRAEVRIFNPYGIGAWYLLSLDPRDPDLAIAIVDARVVTIAPVRISQLEATKVPPFGLPLERDRFYEPKPAIDVYRYVSGTNAQTMAVGGEITPQSGMGLTFNPSSVFVGYDSFPTKPSILE
jgi:hypothetical protein